MGSRSVQTTKSKVRGRRCTCVKLLIVDVVAVVAKPKVRDQGRIDSYIHTGRQAVIRALGVAAIAAQTKSRTARRTEKQSSSKRVSEPAESRERVRLFRDLSIAADVPLIAVEDTRSALDIGVLQAAGSDLVRSKL